ncbi:MAG: hypothetical protein EBR82_70010 [Caulobacteraceae bacterium]|nr:hypothetical protein [Caulobacteraceae bacterium]NBX73794.1 hypothetical protein [Alphaproteobacteria bacterium]
MKQSIYEFITFIIVLGIIDITLSIPFYYLWNWLFVKFFWFDYIDFLESMGFIALLIMLRFLMIDARVNK